MGKTVAILHHSLPNCPEGRMFKEDISGNYYHYMTDEEVLRGTAIINGKEFPLKEYKFTKQEVKDNPDFFEIDDASWYRNGE